MLQRPTFQMLAKGQAYKQAFLKLAVSGSLYSLSCTLPITPKILLQNQSCSTLCILNSAPQENLHIQMPTKNYHYNVPQSLRFTLYISNV